ncbi:unnamed protein product [Linum trigynum]|uniref:Uncharacterized protein n=1 Tax=Linum trigynum TaxID=586398 RepID=A0AAV2EDE9_9ROSI
MAKKGPVVENPHSLSKSDEEDEDEGSSSDWYSLSEIHSLGELKPVLFFWLHHLASVDKKFFRLERTSRYWMFSPKVTELEAEDDAEHKVNVGRRNFTPTGENPDEEGKNLDLDAELTQLNEKKRTAENRVVGLERVSDTVCGMEALKALIEKKVIKI